MNLRGALLAAPVVLFATGAGCAPASRTPQPRPQAAKPVNTAPAQPAVPAVIECDRDLDQANPIAWEEATALIAQARVRAIYQSRCLEVSLDTVDGERYTTTEPALDDVFHAADDAPNGDRIVRVSE